VDTLSNATVQVFVQDEIDNLELSEIPARCPTLFADLPRMTRDAIVEGETWLVRREVDEQIANACPAQRRAYLGDLYR
jgi:hypothetical protein